MADGSVGEYVWETYEQTIQRAEGIGSGLRHLGLNPKDAIGLFSINRPEWIRAEQASFMHNFITVPLYDTLGKEAVKYIVTQTEMKLIVASNDKLKLLLGMYEDIKSVTTIVTMEKMAEEDPMRKEAEEKGIKLLFIDDVEKMGKEKPVEKSLPGLEDIYTICYTSGTTGLPSRVFQSLHLNSRCA